MWAFISYEPNMIMTHQLLASNTADRFFAQIKTNNTVVVVMVLVFFNLVLFHINLVLQNLNNSYIIVMRSYKRFSEIDIFFLLMICCNERMQKMKEGT